MTSKRIFAVLLAALSLAGFGRATEAADKLSWGQINATAFYWDVYVAIDRGFMAQQNLEIDTLRIDAASQSVQMLITGAVDILSGNPELALKAIDKGGDLVVIANETARVPWSLMARSEIGSIKELKGKIVGVTQLNDASTTMTRLLLEKGGLKSGEYEMIQVGGTPTRYAALVKGAIQATVLAQPADLLAAESGMRRLGGVQEAFEGPAIVFAARRSWAQQHQDLTVRFLRGALDGMRWLADPANETEAVRILSKRIKISEEQARATYEFYQAEKVISTNGELPLGHVKNYLALSHETVPEDVSKYVDFSYLEKARAKSPQ